MHCMRSSFVLLFVELLLLFHEALAPSPSARAAVRAEMRQPHEVVQLLSSELAGDTGLPPSQLRRWRRVLAARECPCRKLVGPY